MVWFLSLAQTDMQFSRTELRVREYTYTSIVDWFSTRYKFSWGKNRWLNNLYWNNRMWISTLNHTDNAKCHCKNHNSRRNTKIVCMHVCVRVCVSTNAQHTWRWENHLRCYPPCLRQGLLLFAGTHARLASPQASGVSPVSLSERLMEDMELQLCSTTPMYVCSVARIWHPQTCTR